MNESEKTIVKNSNPVNLTPKQLNRFWKKVDKSGGDDACWIWIGAINSSDYGNWWLNRKGIVSHRASWIIHFGKIPDGLFVCHKCDIRNCVNPKHLWLGTNTDNVRDMERKGRGRHPSGNKNGMRTCPESTSKGCKNGNSKLSDNDVLKIRSEYAIGSTTQRKLAARFSVSHILIGRIVRRKSWRHI